MRAILLLIILFTSSCLYGNTLKKYLIGASGCSAYFLCDPGSFKVEKSDDGSNVYKGECSDGDCSYGIICVTLKDKISDLEVAETVLISYMDYLKEQLKIKKFMGYGKGHHLKEKETNRGVMDYWEDEAGDSWKVKGWTDGAHIVVMYAYASKELPETKVNLFLDGLVLPGM
jgi:hypothetical protein